MADYRLEANGMVVRVADGVMIARDVWIPPDPSNRYRAVYEEWLAAGGVPDPAPPPPVPMITKRQALLFLLSAGKTEADVEAAIAGIADEKAREAALIEWRYPPGAMHHDHPLMQALAPAIGLKAEDLPDAFRAAAKL